MTLSKLLINVEKYLTAKRHLIKQQYVFTLTKKEKKKKTCFDMYFCRIYKFFIKYYNLYIYVRDFL